MLHRFSHNDKYIVMDIPSGSVLSMDKLSFDLCGEDIFPMPAECPESILKKYSGDFAIETVIEAYGELYSLYKQQILFTEEYSLPTESIKSPATPVKALCLHVSHDCNLRCDYCFAQTGDFGTRRSLMDVGTAESAIDFVIASSGTRRNIEIDFFGGEPLMAFDTVMHTVDYAREQGRKHNKVFRFTITTNGVLLDDKITDYINENMDNVVLSLDGRKHINDDMRRTVAGGGSYDIVMPRFISLVKKRSRDKDYYLRGTYTSRNLDFSQDVRAMNEAGFDQLSVEPVSAPEGCGYELKPEHLPRLQAEYWSLADRLLEMDGTAPNFFHFNVDLDQGPCLVKRLRGCGAGCEYVAVTPEGDIYPCHQFVGVEKYLMGNVKDNRFSKDAAAEFAGVSVYTREECGGCWAKYYCSGGCSAANYFSNGDINKCYSLGCELERMRLECAIYLAVMRSD